MLLENVFLSKERYIQNSEKQNNRLVTNSLPSVLSPKKSKNVKQIYMKKVKNENIGFIDILQQLRRKTLSPIHFLSYRKINDHNKPAFLSFFFL